MLPSRLFNHCRFGISKFNLISNSKSLHTAVSSQVTRGSKRDISHPETLCNCDDPLILHKCSKSAKCQYRVNQVPVFIKTYGCQMNKNDTEIVSSILQDYGYSVIQDASVAEIYLIMTCALRDTAENKVWAHIENLKPIKNGTQSLKQIGVLGCMAERLKEKVLSFKDGMVDVVAGPDAYRDLPRLLSVNRLTQEKALNCLLSFDETYCDVRPVTRLNAVTSFISITRGCDNLCSYCVVPFTRGRERSRPINTILDEAGELFNRGVKEVTLLGQNVNSYRDLDTPPEKVGRLDLAEKANDKETFAAGFKTVYKPRTKGLTFDILLEEVAKVSPELRVRFVSPHPKDFTDDVIDVIRRYPNIPRYIHLPAQSGSNSVLQRMRRGYTRETYLDLVRRMRENLPGVEFTSDFITGFCGETDEEFQDTVDLIKEVDYSFLFLFSYSKRTKTHAYHAMEDNVPLEVKNSRTGHLNKMFRAAAEKRNSKLVGKTDLVLLEGDSSRSNQEWAGKGQGLLHTIPKAEILDEITGLRRFPRAGDYVVCHINHANSQSFKSESLYITSMELHSNQTKGE